MSNMSELKTELDRIRKVADTAIAMCVALENKITEVEPEPKSPFARVAYGDEYYCIGGDGSVQPNDEYNAECGNFLCMEGVNAGRGDANFCPNCGADMRTGDKL